MPLPSWVRSANPPPFARGGGIHDDQASTVLEAIVQGPSRTRSNPPMELRVSADVLPDLGKTESEIDAAIPDDSAITNEYLLHLATVLTGNAFRLGKVVKGSFEVRMGILADLLSQALQRNFRPTSSWPKALNKMLKAVKHAGSGRELFVRSGGDALPMGVSWGIVAKSGNKKLPFMAYSELPIVTCAGAGDCTNWCYSKKAWRYPDAYARQFLNTLAAQMDLELHDEKDRQWPDFVAIKCVQEPSRNLRKEKQIFLRLFVDGDFYPGTLRPWMDSCKRIAPGTDSSTYGIEVYGYSKSWKMFTDLAKSGYAWPKNYVVNQSSGSKFESDGNLFKEFAALSVTRGEFRAVNPDVYFAELVKAAEGGALPRSTPTEAKKRIQAFVEINKIDNADTAFQAASFLVDKYNLAPLDIKGDTRKDVIAIRKTMFRAWLKKLSADPSYSVEALLEIAKDQGLTIKKGRFYTKDGTVKMVTVKKKRVEYQPSDDNIRDKVLALHLHEVLWAYGLGGACPLVCGNCSDEIDPNKQGVHRCAAKPGSLFWKKPIHIGLH